MASSNSWRLFALILLFCTVKFLNSLQKTPITYFKNIFKVLVNSKKLKFEKFEIKKDLDVCRANISYEPAEDSTVYIFHVDFEILQQIADVLVMKLMIIIL